MKTLLALSIILLCSCQGTTITIAPSNCDYTGPATIDGVNVEHSCIVWIYK